MWAINNNITKFLKLEPTLSWKAPHATGLFAILFTLKAVNENIKYLQMKLILTCTFLKQWKSNLKILLQNIYLNEISDNYLSYKLRNYVFVHLSQTLTSHENKDSKIINFPSFIFWNYFHNNVWVFVTYYSKNIDTC